MPSAPPNPYIVGPPIVEEAHFFGREEILQAVAQTLGSPQNSSVILYGQRRIGKTSLLRQLERRLSSPRFFAVYVDLLDQALRPAGEVLHDLAAVATARAGLPAPPPAEEFIRAPATFHRVFLPRFFQALGGARRPVFLLDEFERVEQPLAELPEDTAARGLAPYLHQLLTGRSGVAFVFAAGRRMDELSTIPEASFKADLVRLVSVLPPEEGRALILQGGAAGVPAYEEMTISRILAMTRGHPELTQWVCHHLFERAVQRSPQSPQVTLEDVEAIIPQLNEAADSPLLPIWESLPPAERVVLAAVGQRSLTDDLITPGDLEETLGGAGVSTQSRRLQQAPDNLIRWQMLEQLGGAYTFFIEFEGRWVSQKQPLPQVIQAQVARAGAKTGASSQLRPEDVKPAATPAPTRPAPVAEPATWSGGRRGLGLALAGLLLALLLFLVCGQGINPFGGQPAAEPGVAVVSGGTATAEISPTATPVAEAVVVVEATATPVAPATATATIPPEPSPTALPVEPTPTAVAASPTSLPEDQFQPPPPLAGQIRVVGSSSMQPLMATLAEAFSAEHPDVTFVFQPASFQAGLEALRQGEAEVALVSRGVAEAELKQGPALQLFPLTQQEIIVVVTHPLVRVESLSLEQLRAIFAGEITRWSEVGGPDAPIVLVTWAEGAGTRTAFEQVVAGESGITTAETALTVSSDEAMRNLVSNLPYAVGYMVLAYTRLTPTFSPDQVNWAVLDSALLEVNPVALDGIAPDAGNAAGGTYPLVRPFNLVTQASPNEVVQAWLEFLSSPEGQQLLEGAGHLPAR